MVVKDSRRTVGVIGLDTERSAQLSLLQSLVLPSYVVQLMSLNASTAPHAVESILMVLAEESTEAFGVPTK